MHHLSPSLDHVGFFARKVDDVGYALALLRGTSDNDPHGRPLPAFEVSPEHGLPAKEKPRLAVVRFSQWSRAEPEQQRLFDDAVAILREAGAVLEELELPELDQANWDTIQIILSSEARADFQRPRRKVSRPDQ